MAEDNTKKIRDLNDFTTQYPMKTGDHLVVSSSEGPPATNKATIKDVVGLYLESSPGEGKWNDGTTAGDIYYNAGNVGIGTASPNAKLDIQGNSNTTSRLTLTRTDIGRTAVLSASADSPACPFVGSQSNDDFAIYTNNSAKMLIDSNGNVGIGASVPGNLLELRTVNGSGRMAEISVYSDGFDGNATSSIFLGQSLNRRAEISAIRTGSGNSHELAFSTNGASASPAEAMRIDSSGNVGIGTTNPSAPLEVSSTTGGLIVPRMTMTEINNISNPTPGEIAYDTVGNNFYGYDGTSWRRILFQP